MVHRSSVTVREELQRLYVIARAARCSLMILSALRSMQELLNGVRACDDAVRSKSVGSFKMHETYLTFLQIYTTN
jgi:hypothetical protein